MKKLILVFTVILSLIYQGASSQNLIAVQNGGNAAFYTQVTEAVAGANSGDTIYIPGGSWSIGSLQIDKTLHIIGAGHNPDSAQAIGITYLVGSITLQLGCDHGSIISVYLTSNFNTQFSLLSDNYLGFSVRRCRIGGSMSLSGFYSGLIAENIFESQVAGQVSVTQNNGFYNNIFFGLVGGFGDGNNLKNNLFIGSIGFDIYDCCFENNVFLQGTCFPLPISCNCNYCIFRNNLFVNDGIFPTGNGNLGYNNIVNQAQSSIFVNQIGNAFSYSQNYQLQPTCPGKNAGTDGTDIGIYGGMFPWKDGSLPPNPHIQQKIIQQSTDSTGNLNVNIKVAAQDH